MSYYNEDVPAEWLESSAVANNDGYPTCCQTCCDCDKEISFWQAQNDYGVCDNCLAARYGKMTLTEWFK